jgi:hypothetical protein
MEAATLIINISNLYPSSCNGNTRSAIALFDTELQAGVCVPGPCDAALNRLPAGDGPHDLSIPLLVVRPVVIYQ